MIFKIVIPKVAKSGIKLQIWQIFLNSIADRTFINSLNLFT
jgi:hypothetical protein